MTRHVLILAIACSIPVTLASQSPAADPWTRVPALPTSCLADEFPATVRALHETMKSELARQKEANEKVKERLKTMDSQERMSRLQAYMARNPQEAAKVAQAMQSSAMSQSRDVISADADKTALQEQFKEIETAFRGSAEASAKPFREKQGQMISARADPYAGGHRFKSKTDQDAFMDLLKQEDAAYEKACVPYFGAGGKLVSWLNDYRTKVALKVADATDASDRDLATQLAMFEISGYRAIGQLTGVLDYLEKLEAMYAIRYHKAGPPQDLILIR